MGYPGGLERRDYPVGSLPAMPAALRRISWGSVFAGLIVAAMASLILAMLGMAIGLGMVDPMEEANPFSGLGIGTAIWWVASSLIALFLGGWVAARMAGIPRRFDGAVHGVLAWGLVTLLTFYFLGTAIGRLVGGVGNVVGRGISMAGQGVAAVAPEAAGMVKEELNEQGLSMESIRQEAETMLRQSGVTGAAAEAAENPQQGTEGLMTAMRNLAAQGGAAASGADKEAAVNIVAERTGKSRAEAAQIVERWQTTLAQTSQKMDQAKVQAEAKAREYGQTAAAGMSKASMWTFIALLLGGISAALGGSLGAPKDLAMGRVSSDSRVTPQSPPRS